MKKVFITVAIAAIAATSAINAQVGINNEDPKATLDVTAKAPGVKPEGIIAPRVSLADLNTAAGAATPVYGPFQTGAVVYVNDTTGGSTQTQTAKVTAVGYYYFDGLIWQAMSEDNTDWKLTGNAGTNPGTPVAPGTNFLGTTDDQPLMLKVNNTVAGYISNNFSFDIPPSTFLNSGPVAFGFGALAASNNNAYNTVAFGTFALNANTTGRYNTAIGTGALQNNSTGNYNTAVGNWALNKNNAWFCTAVGSHALYNNTTGRNDAFGEIALQSNSTGTQNAAFGAGALSANETGNNNSAFGRSTLSSASAANRNNAFGSDVLYSTTSGSNNCGFGSSSLTSNTTGSNNSAFGDSTLIKNLTGSFNAAFGKKALAVNTASQNSAFGYNALAANTSGANNAAFGNGALAANTASDGNSAFGSQALGSATKGAGSSAFGYKALSSFISVNVAGNDAFGNLALNSNTNGSGNAAFGQFALMAYKGNNSSAFGNGALQSSGSGGPNNAFGFAALNNTGVGMKNCAFGDSTLWMNTSGNYNVAFGSAALYKNPNGSGNVAIGSNALSIMTMGNYNTVVGHNAGLKQTNGNNNILIGADIDAPIATGSNQMNIGNSVFGTGMNGSVAAPAGKIGINQPAPVSTLDVGGSVSTAIVNTADAIYTLTDKDYTLICTSATTDSVKVILPDPATCKGRVYHVVNATGVPVVFSLPILLSKSSWLTSKDPITSLGSSTAQVVDGAYSSRELNAANYSYNGNVGGILYMTALIQSDGSHWWRVGI